MDRMRTMLFCPASQPKIFLNAPVFQPDAILFDLEDAVAYAEKDSARDLLCEAVGQLDFGACRVFVRINSGSWTGCWPPWRRSISSPSEASRSSAPSKRPGGY